MKKARPADNTVIADRENPFSEDFVISSVLPDA